MTWRILEVVPAYNRHTTGKYRVRHAPVQIRKAENLRLPSASMAYRTRRCKFLAVQGIAKTYAGSMPEVWRPI